MIQGRRVGRPNESVVPARRVLYGEFARQRFVVRTRPIIALIATFFVFTVCQARECAMTVQILGGRHGRPLPGAKVELRTEHDNAPLATYLTDATGNARLGDLESGARYRITGSFLGYVPQDATVTCSLHRPGLTRFVLREIQRVSLVQLISNPAAWEGKPVGVVGFLNLEFEGTALYLHREDWKQGLTANAVWVDVPVTLAPCSKKMNGRYAAIQGTFNASQRGHMGLFSGSLTNILTCDPR
jgi:hypothetical protein